MNRFNWGDNKPAIKLTRHRIDFNAAAIDVLGTPDKVAVAFDDENKNTFAVRPATEGNSLVYTLSRSVKTKTVYYISATRLLKMISPNAIAFLHKQKSYTIKASAIVGNVLIFDSDDFVHAINKT